MKVFIANFGRKNYEWPRCFQRGTVATMNDEGAYPFWQAGDRQGYVEYCLAHLSTAVGIKPVRPVASRWFNLMTIISETDGDIWIHREKEQFWWTQSTSAAAQVTLENDPATSDMRRVYVCHKPCLPWSNQDRKGSRMEWEALHPKAKEFLFTEGTLQQLTEDNAAYALALIAGDDLSFWHTRRDWEDKLNHSKRLPITIFSARRRAIVRMTMTALDTATYANGQQALRHVKNKEIKFTRDGLEAYIAALIEAQEGLCALTEIPLQYDGEHSDAELLCSLDRIDSAGHYTPGNLQVVCKFANRWKSDADNDSFRRLIDVVREIDAS